MSKQEFLINKRNRIFIVGAVIGIALFFCALLVSLNLENEKEYVEINPDDYILVEEGYVPNEVVVQFKEEVAPAELAEGDNKGFPFFRKSSKEKLSELNEKLTNAGVIAYEEGYVPDDSDYRPFYTLKFQENIDVREALRRVNEISEIESVEPNYIATISAVPNDPSYSQLWGMGKIQAPDAWEITKGSSDVTVAVIDTGIDYTHSELTNSEKGIDFANADNDGRDDHYHGTHVAGTIGALGDNGAGVVGVNWNVKMIAVKVLRSNGSGPFSAINDGIKWAADNGAKVINMSLGSSSPASCTSSSQDALHYALSKGVVVVVAAGNSPPDEAANYTYGGCKQYVSDMIVVAATDSNDQKGSFSKHGSAVDIAAPGVDIFSTVPGEKYNVLSGTSMASPHVAGAAALILSKYPTLTPQQVKQCLIDGGDAINTGYNVGPRLNVKKALDVCSGITAPEPTTDPGSPSPTDIVSGPSPTPDPANPHSIFGSVYIDTNSNGQKDGTEGYQGATLTLTGPQNGSVVSDANGEYLFANLPAGTYSLTLSVLGGTRTESPIDIGPNKQVDFRIDNVSSEPISTPLPTSGTNPGGGGGTNPTPIKMTPTPTPVPYKCEVDPQCLAGGKNIHLCQLLCTPR